MGGKQMSAALGKFHARTAWAMAQARERSVPDAAARPTQPIADTVRAVISEAFLQPRARWSFRKLADEAYLASPGAGRVSARRLRRFMRGKGELGLDQADAVLRAIGYRLGVLPKMNGYAKEEF